MFKRWNYRIRDCKTKTTTNCTTLDQVTDIITVSDFLLNNLKGGFSVADGIRYKVDVRGSFCDNSWDM